MYPIINPFARLLKDCRRTQEEDQYKNFVVNFIMTLVSEVNSRRFCLEENTNLAALIQSRLSVAYSEAEAWFIEKEGKSIFQYAVEVRLSKVKELLVYTDLPLEVIAGKLNYPSAGDMEVELRQQTGLPVSFFRQMKKQKINLVLRRRLNDVN